MFAIPGLVGILFLVYIRPQEFIPILGRVPWIYIGLLLAAVGCALDVRRGFARLQSNPLLPWAGAYFGWAFVTLAVKAPWDILSEMLGSMVSLCLFLMVAGSLQTLRSLRIMATVLLCLSLSITLVGVHQAFAPLGCVKQSDDPTSDQLVPDGRSCEVREDCYEGNLEAGVEYRCEHIGLAGTTSVLHRVRYRGIMQDPNELAVIVSIGVPFAIALLEMRKTLPRALLVAFSVAATGLCTIFTQSRSGQLAFMAVLGVYFLRRWKALGLVLAALVAGPVMMLGGRSGDSADESTMSRYEAWDVAFELARQSPIFGMGKGQFTEFHERTAHNSMMLALGELGLAGLFFWSAVVYFAFKVPMTLLSGRSNAPPLVRLWATALLSAMCGLMVSSMFLSFSDHNIFWIYLGLVGALYAGARELMPDFRVASTAKDLLAVVAIDGVLLVFLKAYLRTKV